MKYNHIVSLVLSTLLSLQEDPGSILHPGRASNPKRLTWIQCSPFTFAEGPALEVKVTGLSNMTLKMEVEEGVEHYDKEPSLI